MIADYSTTPPSGKSPTLVYPPLHPELLENLVEAVREPLIVCLGSRRSNGSLSRGRVLTANPMACALLNLDLETVKTMPLASLVATASGRPPPSGLVSKCTLFCKGAESVAVEVDCRVFSADIGGKNDVPLLFCHLALMDVNSHAGTRTRRGLGGSRMLQLSGLPSTGSDHVVRSGAEETVASASEAAEELEANDEDLASPRARALADVQLERLRILVVEDDVFSSTAIMELCRQCDFAVETVTSGEECLQKLEADSEQPLRERFNLVLCDVMMHGMDGREVLMQIRKRYGDEIAVIMISSNEQHEMVEACIRAGADSYLFKPLRIADFSNIWQFVMQQRCHKLHAERREMRYLRNQQLARMKQIQAEKARAIALADADREKAQREQAEAEAARQHALQELELDRQREHMQKEIMRLLHQQVHPRPVSMRYLDLFKSPPSRPH